MPLIPDKIREAIDFCLVHANVWLANAPAVGLTAAQATAFKSAVTAADASFTARENAANAAKAATVTQASAVGAMRTSAADTVRLIRAFAETQANPDAVYAIAQIPPPANPTPVPPPGRPTDFRVLLNSGGSITLKWKCDNPRGAAGTVYHVMRRVADGPIADLGTIGVRSFTDETVPAAGAGVGVTYIVQAQRADLLGEASLPLIVQFGVAGGGGGGGGGGGFSISSATSGGVGVPVKQAA